MRTTLKTRVEITNAITGEVTHHNERDTERVVSGILGETTVEQILETRYTMERILDGVSVNLMHLTIRRTGDSL